jgi:cell division protein FtsL
MSTAETNITNLSSSVSTNTTNISNLQNQVNNLQLGTPFEGLFQPIYNILN